MSTDLRAVVEGIPQVEDRVLLELTNAITVAADMVAYRTNQAFFPRLAATMLGLGADRKREVLTARALTDGQRALTDWLTEVSGRQAFTSLAMERMADHLKEARQVAQRSAELSRQTADELHELEQVVARIAGVFDERLAELERWRAGIQLRLDAADAFELSVGRWEAGQSYATLPWPCQVLLLAREVASGPSGDHELASDDSGYRDRLVNRILGDARTPEATTGFALSSVLDRTARELPSNNHRLMVAELLEAGLSPRLALPAGPLAATVMITMELAVLSEELRPSRPAATALDLSRRRYGWLDGSATTAIFVRLVVNELADRARQARTRLEVLPYGP
jgi:hypothetical protein